MFCNRFVCFFTFISLVFCGVTAEQKSCAKSITCTGLKQCSPYMKFIKSQTKPLQPFLVKFLKEQQCGFEDGFPKVCCDEVPNSLQAKSSQQRLKKNNLSAIHDEPIELTKAQKKITPNNTVTPKTTKRPVVNKEQIARDGVFDFPPFYLIDMMGPFDLFRRKRGSEKKGDTSGLDVEIR